MDYADSDGNSKASWCSHLQQRSLVWRQKTRHRLKVWRQVIRTYPSVIIWPLVNCVVLMALGLWAVFAALQATRTSQEDAARNMVATAADSFQMALSQSAIPPSILAASIKRYPDWYVASAILPDVWMALQVSDKSSAGLHSISLAPNGVTRVFMPAEMTVNSTGLPGSLSFDYFRNNITRDESIRMLKNGDFETRVIMAETSISDFKLLVRVPIFIANVSEDLDYHLPGQVYNCPEDLCYNATTRSKFWGFAEALLPLWETADPVTTAAVQRLGQYYAFRTYIQYVDLHTGEPRESVFMQSPESPKKPIKATIDIKLTNPTCNFYTMVAPLDGWDVVWGPPAIAMVVFIPCFVALMQFGMQMSRRQHKMLLESIVPKRMMDQLRNQGNLLMTKAMVSPGTAADKILAVVGDLVDGKIPDMADVLTVRTAIMHSYDIYTPLDLDQQIAASALDQDVASNMMRLLGNVKGRVMEEIRKVRHRRNSGISTSASMNSFTESQCSPRDTQFSTLQGALQALVTGLPGGVLSASQAPPLMMDADITLETGAGDASYCSGMRSTPSLGAALTNDWSGCSKEPIVPPQGAGGSGTATPSGKHPQGQGGLKDAVGMRKRHSHHELALPAHSQQQQQQPPVIATVDYAPQPLHYLAEQLDSVLASSDMWEFDAFKLAEVTQGHPLSTLGYYLMHETGLIAKFKLRKLQLARYLRVIEDGYRCNPYHNKTHAADVLQTLHVILLRGGFIPGYCDPLTHLACLLSAVVHDYAHHGVTNDFLINTCDSLALTYNDRSPMENHHVSAACVLMRQGEYNFMGHLPKEEQDKLRKLMIDLVLATDMKQHFATVSHFTALHRLTNNNGGANGGGASSPGSESSNRNLPRGTAYSAAPPEGAALAPLDEAERVLSLQMALKCADVGHIAESLPVHLKWVSSLEEEFFRQGDREKTQGVPVSPLFDRDKPGVTKSQVGFFNFVVLPMMTSLSAVFQGTKPMLSLVQHNYQYWQEQEAAQKAQQQQQQQPGMAARSCSSNKLPAPPVAAATSAVTVTATATGGQQEAAPDRPSVRRASLDIGRRSSR